MDKREKLLIRIVRDAGLAIRRIGLTEVQRTKMHELDLVTKGDLESERIIVSAIQKSFPKDEILSEETEEGPGIRDTEEYLWVIDPVDGTLNYSRGRNYYSVSVAITKKRQIIHGAVYNPLTNDFFFAQKGKGSYLNNKKIHCSQVSDPYKALLGTDNSSTKGAVKKHLEILLKFETAKYYISGSGTMNMCEVAAGRIDLYFHTSSKPWDNSAGFLIASEAGARISNLKGEEIDFYSPELLIANPELHRNFLAEINT